MQSAILWIGVHANARAESAEAVAAMWAMVILASSMNAFVAFIVTCFYSRSFINVLLLD
jgi:hypothetical protein